VNRVDRLTAILLMLQERPRTSDEIARRFEISKRTVLRDVQALSEMGVPVIAREGSGGGYSLPENYRTPPLPLTTHEIFLLLLALGSLNALADAPFAGARASLMGKLAAALPAAQQAEARALLDAVTLDTPTRAERASHFDGLIQALREGTWVRVRYRSATRASDKLLYPRALHEEGGLWYLTAYAACDEEDRRYRVDRIDSLTLATLDHRPPPPVDYHAPAHPLVRVTLTARGVALAEGIADLARHLRDGHLSFRCPPSELAYYSRLLAGFGAEACVHEPAELRQRLAVLGRELLNSNDAER
jgi:predicted DNA-binding transcriptional regulator YafY